LNEVLEWIVVKQWLRRAIKLNYCLSSNSRGHLVNFER
jgi:hypothetical protein